MTRERLLLGAILVMGAWVRLSGLDLGWFLQDQVRDGMTALGILAAREFPLVGPLSATGKLYLSGPLYYYVVAVPYALSSNPAVGVGLVSLLNLVSIYLTYRLGRDMFGPTVGLTGAALYAVFPMAVLSSKALWNPAFIPFLTTLFLLTLWRFLTSRRPWGLALPLLILGAFLQIHASAAIFLLLLPVALALYRPPLAPWPVATGLLGIVLLFAPYLVFELRHGFTDLQKFWTLAGAQSAGQPGQPFWVIGSRALWVPFLLPERMAAALPAGIPLPLFPAAQRVELALCAFGLGALIVRLAKAQDRRPYVLLALWLVLPFVLVFLLRPSVLWYYFDILYPVQFLLIGLLVRLGPDVWPDLRQRPASRFLGAVTAVLVGALVVSQAAFLMGFQRAVARSGILRFTPDINLGFPDPAWHVPITTILETMPLRFRRALAERFVRELRVDHTALERTGHGAVYQQFREDKGFSFLTVPSPGRPSPPDLRLHYVLLRGIAGGAPGVQREVVVGPYTIVAYHPTLRHDSWRWRVSPGPGWWREGFADASWEPVSLPARSVPDRSVYEPIPYARWPSATVSFRGWLEVASAGRPGWLAVNIRDDHLAAHDVDALYVNGQAIEPTRRVPYNTVNSRNVEVIADVTPALRPGLNLVALRITGMSGEFDLDIYELPGANAPVR